MKKKTLLIALALLMLLTRRIDFQWSWEPVRIFPAMQSYVDKIADLKNSIRDAHLDPAWLYRCLIDPVN